MKKQIVLLFIFIALCFTAAKLKGQTNYTLTNNAPVGYYVTIDIANEPVACSLYTGIQIRQQSCYLTASGCSGNTCSIQIYSTEWVYKVTIISFNNCPTCGSGNTPDNGTALFPCTNYPQYTTGSLTGCGSDRAEADALNECVIYD